MLSVCRLWNLLCSSLRNLCNCHCPWCWGLEIKTSMIIYGSRPTILVIEGRRTGWFCQTFLLPLTELGLSECLSSSNRPCEKRTELPNESWEYEYEMRWENNFKIFESKSQINTGCRKEARTPYFKFQRSPFSRSSEKVVDKTRSTGNTYHDMGVGVWD